MWRVEFETNTVHYESKMAANLYIHTHTTLLLSFIYIFLINCQRLFETVKFCIECMQEYLHYACHTFFATTTTPHYPGSAATNQYGGEEALKMPDKKGPLANTKNINFK